MKNETALTLFREGRYQECSSLIKSIVKDKLNPSGINVHIRQLCTDNNLFVSDQLAQNWETLDLKAVVHNWEIGMVRALDIHRSLQYQQQCCDVPNDIALCIVHNTLLWAVMKVDPLLQHKSLVRDTLRITALTLRNCTSSLGNFNLSSPCYNNVNNFVYLGQCVIPRLLDLSPDQCHLLIDIFILLLILVFDEMSNEEITVAEECIGLIDTVVAASSQLNLHVSSFSQSDRTQRIYPKLFKFGFCNLGEVLDRQYFQNNVSLSLEAFHLIGAMLCVRLKQYDDSLRYLNAIQAPQCVFLFHYVKALIELELNNVDACMYQLSRAPIFSSDFFKQARFYSLKGQALLLKKKPVEALTSLRQIEYNQKEVHLPIAAFITAQVYAELGDIKQQIEVLSLLVECLSAEPPVQPMLLSPLVGLEHRLLLTTHSQPEITYPEVLYAFAAACMPTQPEKASELLVELLRLMEFKTDDVIRKILKKFSSVIGFLDLLHDTACALLKAGSAAEAQLLLQTCLQTYQDRLESVVDQKANLKSLKEDVISLMLLSEAQVTLNSSDVADTCNRCAKLLQDFIENQKKTSGSDVESLLAKKLLARVYFQKAQLNIGRNFSDDAIACFQRAVSFNQDDAEVLLAFADHLMNCNQFDESLSVWTLYCDRQTQRLPEDTTLKYLLEDKMRPATKQDIIFRLQSLIEG